jgi:DNA-binding NarL/FixJ family response regulator
MKTLLAIHQADLRVAIEILLREEPMVEIIGIVSTFQALQALTGPVQPDLLILDLDLPGLEDFSGLRQIGAGACPQIIALGSRHANPDAVLAAGANAFVEKGAPPRDLVAVIRRLESRPAPHPSPTEEEES